MPQRTVTIASAVGLHARPAALFVQAASSATVPVTITKAGRPTANAASILAVMGLGARFGDQVTLVAEGDGADDLLDDLQRILSTDLDAL
jgi:phosphocarrier protein